ncbi:MAG: tRNA wybutosine-synthesizing 3 family protein [archaeon]
MGFENQKSMQLSKQDKSDKGDWDKDIIPLINTINKKKEYYTTSSCSGRIVLLKGKEKKEVGLFLFRTHDRVSLEELKKALGESVSKYKGLIHFKQECSILHVACESFKKAQDIVDKAKFCGWKKSGIIASNNRVIAELLSTEKIEMPIANNGRVLVSEEYLSLLVKEANNKLERTREKIKKLEKLLQE